jgi:hypothetical protein
VTAHAPRPRLSLRPHQHLLSIYIHIPSGFPRVSTRQRALFAEATKVGFSGAGGVNDGPVAVAAQQAVTKRQHPHQAGGPSHDAKRARAAGKPQIGDDAPEHTAWR